MIDERQGGTPSEPLSRAQWRRPDGRWAYRQLIASRIIDTAWQVRSSAQGFFRNETGLCEVERKIVVELGTRGPLRLCQLAALLDRDKAQTGRNVRAITGLGIVAPRGLRDPVRLNAAGTALYDRFGPLIAFRNRQLQRGLGEADLLRACRSMALIRDAALQSLGWDDRAMRYDPSCDKGLLVPTLMRTSRALRQAARADDAGLSTLAALELQVLMAIAEQEMVTLSGLVALFGRDKGQLSRIVQTLAAGGLVEARPLAAPRQKGLEATSKGMALCDRVAARAVRADADHLALLDEDAHHSLRRVLATLAANAPTADAVQVRAQRH